MYVASLGPKNELVEEVMYCMMHGYQRYVNDETVNLPLILLYSGEDVCTTTP